MTLGGHHGRGARRLFGAKDTRTRKTETEYILQTLNKEKNASEAIRTSGEISNVTFLTCVVKIISYVRQTQFAQDDED